VVTSSSAPKNVAIVGAGPGGLFAAEIIAQAGHRVTVYERMPSPARKFLMAGRGGLNLTHGETLDRFLPRYGSKGDEIRKAVSAFPPERLIDWVHGLGVETFKGTSGRIFPKEMKASPLLRAWLRRLAALGVTIKLRHRWTGFASGPKLAFATPQGTIEVEPDASLFALGGASWPKLGSDGGWVEPFRHDGIAVTPLEPANCGVLVKWSDVFKARFEGVAVKRIKVAISDASARGEAIVTATGLEGGAIYALIPQIRAALEAGNDASLLVDLKPDLDQNALALRLNGRKPSETVTNYIRKATHLDPVAVSLLREASSTLPADPGALAARIKALPLQVVGLTTLDRAISTAGGVAWSALDDNFMLARHPGVFVAGEMLDWEAPTGGYLLQGTFATAATAANGLLAWLSVQQ
jgi:uncharacterized flavoprotein (TIGR03862 family)